MDEQTWVNSEEPRLLRDYLESVKGSRLSLIDGVSSRKLRLLVCACVRRAWDLLPDDRCRHAVEVAERFADGLVTEKERDAAHLAANSAREDISRCTHDEDERNRLYYMANEASHAAGSAPVAAVMSRFSRAAEACGRKTHNDLIRDVFGNPFRPVTIDPAWLLANDAAVVRIARGIYEERAFDRMPVLADALEDAGCTDEQVLGHCRGGGPHVRGCFVIDLLLNKS